MRALLGAIYDAIPGKRLLLEPLRRLGFLPESVFRHLHFQGVFRVQADGGSFLLRHHETQIENEIFWRGLGGGWEGVTLQSWMRLARTAATIVDVGANTGVFALAARAVNEQARVVALEPVARVHARLVENIRLNGGTVEAFQTAASDKDGVARIFDPPGDHPLAATLQAGGYASAAGWPSVEVSSVRLDTLLGSDPRGPLLIKVDVEGHEPAVVRGLGGLLDTARPTLFLEVLSPEAAAELNRLFAGKRYRFFHLHDSGGPQAMEHLALATGGYNFLASPEGDR